MMIGITKGFFETLHSPLPNLEKDNDEIIKYP